MEVGMPNNLTIPAQHIPGKRGVYPSDGTAERELLTLKKETIGQGPLMDANELKSFYFMLMGSRGIQMVRDEGKAGAAINVQA